MYLTVCMCLSILQVRAMCVCVCALCLQRLQHNYWKAHAFEIQTFSIQISKKYM